MTVVGNILAEVRDVAADSDRHGQVVRNAGPSQYSRDWNLGGR